MESSKRSVEVEAIIDAVRRASRELHTVALSKCLSCGLAGHALAACDARKVGHLAKYRAVARLRDRCRALTRDALSEEEECLFAGVCDVWWMAMTDLERDQAELEGQAEGMCRHHPKQDDCGCYCKFVGCSPETCPE